MAKCIRCGKSTVVRGHVKLRDAAICTPCFKQLGFKLTETAGAVSYFYDDIKDGKDEYYENMRKKKIKDAVLSSVSVRMSGAGYNRELICTEEEREIYDIIRSLCDDANYESDWLELVRRNDEYVTIIINSSDGSPLELARLKYTNRAKWIRFAPEFEKIQLTDTEDITNYTENIYAAYAFNEPYI